jgi:hypothetical protein
MLNFDFGGAEDDDDDFEALMTNMSMTRASRHNRGCGDIIRKRG